MKLTDAYEPVSDDLNKVEAELSKLADVEMPLLAQLLDYAVKSSGKRIRPAFTLLAGKFYNYNLEKLVPMAVGVELLHSATLIHDDIVDNSPLRRGKPTISAKWGRNAALLLGDYLFAKAAITVASTGNLRAVKLFAEALMTISGGELGQIGNLFDVKSAREIYYKWIGAKTACLFSTATESGAILSDAPEESIQALKMYGYYFGMAFQIIDDVLDFVGTENELGKPVGSDLGEGAVTLPSILFAGSEEGKDLIKGILAEKDKELVSRAIGKIKGSSIIEECVSIATDFSNKACRSLEILPANSAKKSFEDLADYIIKRRK